MRACRRADYRFSGLGSFSESIGSLDQDFQIVDNLSIVKGKHNIKLGENFIHEKFFEITDFAGVPTFAFQGQYYGVGLGDYLLGEPYSGTTSVGDSHQNLRSNYYAVFLQDDWRVMPRLTFNIGAATKRCRILMTRKTARSGLIRRPLTPSTEPAEPWSHPGAVGFATASWTRSGTRSHPVSASPIRLSLRTPWSAVPTVSSGPAMCGTIFSSWWSVRTSTLAKPLPPPLSTNLRSTCRTCSLPEVWVARAVIPFSVDKRYRDPYVQEWTFDVQHNFAKDWLADVAYVGNVGQKLRLRQDQNYRKSYDPTGLIPYRMPYPIPTIAGS